MSYTSSNKYLRSRRGALALPTQNRQRGCMQKEAEGGPTFVDVLRQDVDDGACCRFGEQTKLLQDLLERHDAGKGSKRVGTVFARTSSSLT